MKPFLKHTTNMRPLRFDDERTDKAAYWRGSQLHALHGGSRHRSYLIAFESVPRTASYGQTKCCNVERFAAGVG